MACLEKDPHKRPQTASELIASLNAVPLPAPWTPYRAEHWWQAHRPTSRRQQNLALPQYGGRGGVMKSGRRDSTMHAAAFGAAALIASQVAGKATRDAFFLSQFPVTALPVMVIVASLLSVAAGFVTASPPEHPSDQAGIFHGASWGVLRSSCWNGGSPRGIPRWPQF